MLMSVDAGGTGLHLVPGANLSFSGVLVPVLANASHTDEEESAS